MKYLKNNHQKTIEEQYGGRKYVGRKKIRQKMDLYFTQ